jgi:hypothetical protein
LHCDSHFICASLFLLSQLINYKPQLFALIASIEKIQVEDGAETEKEKVENDEEVIDEMENESVKSDEGGSYDPTKREPKFAGGEKELLWELIILTQHFHPTVVSFFSFSLSFSFSFISDISTLLFQRKWAESLTSGHPIEYSGDPLLDFALNSFLDRYSFRNPKTRVTEKGIGQLSRHSIAFSKVS